jgi:hypothetical protein
MSSEAPLAHIQKQKPSSQPEKSQAELRGILEQTFIATKSKIDNALAAYDRDTFEDAPDEAAGSGEKRQEAMQKKLLAMVERFEKLRAQLDSGEILEDTSSTFEFAEALFGKDYLGPEAVEKVFGIEPEDVPPIPFSTEELERAQELGQQLILYIDHMPSASGLDRPLTLEHLKQKFTEAHDDGEVFRRQDWYEGEDFFKNEKPRTGWRLTSKDLIPGSTSSNYLEQTETLITHLTEEVFKGMKLPKQFEDAVAEFNREKGKIATLMSSDWQAASKALSELAITKLTRELPVETMYRLVLNDQARKDKPLPSTYTWTASRASVGRLVWVGRFDGSGADVSRVVPGYRDVTLGVSFSRS